MSNLFKKKFFEEITFIGSLIFYLLIISLSFITNKPYTFKLLFALLFIYLLALIIRIFYFKPRPDKIKYKSFIEKIDASSLPSVHSARATFLLIFLISSFTLSYIYLFISAIFWALALYSRIFLKKHDLVDVLSGVLLGILTSLITLFI